MVALFHWAFSSDLSELEIRERERHSMLLRNCALIESIDRASVNRIKYRANNVRQLEVEYLEYLRNWQRMKL